MPRKQKGSHKTEHAATLRVTELDRTFVQTTQAWALTPGGLPLVHVVVCDDTHRARWTAARRAFVSVFGPRDGPARLATLHEAAARDPALRDAVGQWRASQPARVRRLSWFPFDPAPGTKPDALPFSRTQLQTLVVTRTAARVQRLPRPRGWTHWRPWKLTAAFLRAAYPTLCGAVTADNVRRLVAVRE